MSAEQLRALCVFLVCVDGESLTKEHDILKDFANKEALIHGFTDWVDAYHKIQPNN